MWFSGTSYMGERCEASPGQAVRSRSWVGSQGSNLTVDTDLGYESRLVPVLTANIRYNPMGYTNHSILKLDLV